tara:strand:+ start:29677 stop:31086 length:1410 start_codon:yes stop_codon:yes gene_type:complete
MLFSHPATFTDLYELTMAQGYYLSNRQTETATFDYFFRRAPFDGGYVLFAGLSDFLEMLKEYHFKEDELNYLKEKGFKDSFIDYLRDFKFTGSIYSVKEGEIIFPNEPVLRVEGSILETQVIETLLLNTLNFESLIATKSARIRQVAGNKTVVDFGLRRSQGFGGIQASKAAVIGGLNGTSNVFAGLLYDLEISGTMAHSWIQSFDDELTAFRTYAQHYPDSCVLLVDTYDTLKSGVPNAIEIAKELSKNGHQLVGIRLDSGDLAYFSKKARKMLDEAGFTEVKIAVSNQLDEHLIKSLEEQNAPIDLFGVGTRLITAYDNPALDGVYKLSEINGNPTLKISENVEKITLPAAKKITRYYNKDGTFNCDGISLVNEPTPDQIQHPYFPTKKTEVGSLSSEELLEEVVRKGEVIISIPSATESAAYAAKQITRLNAEHKRFDNPHVYKVGISKPLANLRDRIINERSKNG